MIGVLRGIRCVLLGRWLSEMKRIVIWGGVCLMLSRFWNGRGGACTSYFSGFDPEVDVLLRLKNPMSTEDRKIRGMDYSWGYNMFLIT